MTALLELEGISKAFPGVRALEDVHFSVAAGEIHALVGENGAGKSTLIKVISGVHRARQRQRSACDGEEVHVRQPARGAGGRHRHDVPGAQPLPGAHGGREHLHGPRAAARRRPLRGRGLGLDGGPGSPEVLDSLDIHDMDVGRKVGTLNVGNRQRVEIAKALSINARVLIMDEPTAALTEADVEHASSASCACLKERGVAVIYISHRLNEVFELADRVTVLRDGQLRRLQARRRGHRGRTHPHDGRPHHHGAVPQAAQRDPGVPSWRSATCSRRPHTQDVSFTVRGWRDRGHGRPRGLWPQRDGPARLRHPGARLGRDPHRGPEGGHPLTRPGHEARHRLRARRIAARRGSSGTCASARTSRWRSWAR